MTVWHKCDGAVVSIISRANRAWKDLISCAADTVLDLMMLGGPCFPSVEVIDVDDIPVYENVRVHSMLEMY